MKLANENGKKGVLSNIGQLKPPFLGEDREEEVNYDLNLGFFLF